MAAKRKSSKKLDKKKKRKWYSIVAPKGFGNAELGESFVSTPQNMIGKRIRINPAHITKIRSSNIRLTFQVTDIKEEKGLTELIKYQILPNQITRIVRKRKSKLDTSQILESKDKVNLTIKTIIVTRSKIQRGAFSALKNQALAQIKETIEKENFNKLLDLIISYELQRSLKNSLKTITPIQTVEIKYFSKK